MGSLRPQRRTQSRNAARGERLIFIGGAPRSGTTLVQNMIDSHPAVLGGPEFLGLPDIGRLRKRLHTLLERQDITLYTSPELVDGRLAALIEDLLLPLADRRGYHLLSEKTPDNVLVFIELGQLLPEARFIHVVRHPYAVVASMLEVGNRYRHRQLTPPPFTANVNRAVRRLKDCYQAGFRAGRQMSDRVLTVPYEDLVQHPEYKAQEMCDFLELEWAPAMLRPAEQEHSGANAITAGGKGSWYDAEAFYRNPDTASIDKWRRTLGSRDRVRIAQAFRGNADLAALGYEFSIEGWARAVLWTGFARRAVTVPWRKLAAGLGGSRRSRARRTGVPAPRTGQHSNRRR